MGARYSYFEYEGMACRVAQGPDGPQRAEMYQVGVGFVKAPKMSVLFMGRPLNKAQFDAMILAMARTQRPEA